MWQVSGRSDITDFEEVVRLDKEYQRAKWGKLASTYIMLGEKCAVKFADEIIVLSEGVQKYFMDTYGRKTQFILLDAGFLSNYHDTVHRLLLIRGGLFHNP